MIRRRFVPLPLALLVAFPIGVAFAWMARAELVRHEGSVVGMRPYWVALAFGLLVLAPASAYFAAFHGDWAYLYLVPSNRVPSAVDLAVVLLDGALVPLAFVVASPFCRARKGPVVLTLFAVPLATGGAVALVAQARLASSATYAQFHGGFGVQSIAQTSLGPSVLLALSVVCLAVAWSTHLIRGPRPRTVTHRK